MIIAIHIRKGSFSDRWITYCQENNFPYKVVNCYSSDIIEQIKGCDGLMWHWSHEDYRAQNFARQLIFTVEKMGIKVFPNFDSCWHFDDKVGQKYLLESINAPLVPSFVFYDKKEALEWIDNTKYPKVFKLRGGAGSFNVKLIKNKNEAKRVVKKAFGRGFPLFDSISHFKQRLWEFKRDKTIKAIIHVIKGIMRFAYPPEGVELLQCQKGYIYIQNFIPDNEYDTRIIVIGNRCLGLRRYNREGDFRASGSGLKDYDHVLINIDLIKLSFDIARKLGSQSVAFDYVLDNNKPKVIEVSYCFPSAAEDSCQGFWDNDLVWHDEKVNAEYFIIENFIKSLIN